jgi:hypothetical protein
MKDLIVLVADKNMEFTVKGVLQRTASLKISEILHDIKVHTHRDPGVYKTAHDFLRMFINQYSYALVMLDKEGCGCDEDSNRIAENIQSRLDSSGWKDRSKVIVLDPELEIWVWSDSPEVALCIGWNNSELRGWLLSEGHILPNAHKPRNPKRAFEDALRVKQKPRSSAIYGKLAERVSLERCTDKAFQTLKNTLQCWFSAGSIL